MTLRRLALTLCAGLCLARVASAAVVAWESPHNIADDNDVSTLGMLVVAHAFGPEDVEGGTVNGVTFAPFPIPGNLFLDEGVTIGNVDLQETEELSTLYREGFAPVVAPPFSGLSTDYQTVLSSFATAGVTFSLQLTLSGLINGQEYQFQYWTNVSVAGSSGEVAVDGGPNTSINTTGVAGGVGQFGTGTFMADGATQTFLFSGDSSMYNSQPFVLPVLNAFQLRAIPEASPAALVVCVAVVAGAGQAIVRRRAAP